MEGLDPDAADELRCGITAIGSTYELQGFLRDYEYCLKMLNLLRDRKFNIHPGTFIRRICEIINSKIDKPGKGWYS